MVPVTVARDIFDMQGDPHNGEGWEIEPTFLVVADDSSGAAAALQAAGRRFLAVNDRGEELLDWEAARAGDYRTPRNVSDVQIIGAGPAVLRVNTGGWLPTGMAARMLAILVEELEARAVTAHITGTAGFVQGVPWTPQ
jgi:hypothetical protein